jgi:hypothetical protein
VELRDQGLELGNGKRKKVLPGTLWIFGNWARRQRIRREEGTDSEQLEIDWEEHRKEAQFMAKSY